MAKKVEIDAAPNLLEAAKRKRQPIEFVREELKISSSLREYAIGKKYYIHTFGCQGNVLDGQTIEGILLEIGYAPIDDPYKADLVILNTCAIREGAEDKVFGEIGALKVLKKNNPHSIIAVCGCMTQQPHIVDTLRKKYQQVDIVFGTHNINHIPELLDKVINHNIRVIEVYSKEGEVIENLPCYREDKIKAFVNIMYGCDKFCAYCIVPYTRGKQRSRTKEDVLKECKELIDQGYMEITLIGQNVNAYGKDLNDGTKFSDLLEEVAKLGIPRLRFTTSHPWDFTEEMFRVIAKYKNIMPSIHLPLQSGSDEVLKRMGRRYTKESYCELVDKLREIVPNVSITTDIIVGFPNETDEDFEKTLEVVNYVQYDSAFTFIFSPRVGTPAYRMEDKTPMEVKHKRFNELLETVNKYAKIKSDAYIGKTVKVLIDGASKKDTTILSGYTDTNKLVNFKGNPEHIGKIVNVKITEATTFYLKGDEVNE